MGNVHFLHGLRVMRLRKRLKMMRKQIRDMQKALVEAGIAEYEPLGVHMTVNPTAKSQSNAIGFTANVPDDEDEDA